MVETSRCFFFYFAEMESGVVDLSGLAIEKVAFVVVVVRSGVIEACCRLGFGSFGSLVLG
jgi:hypothetical protein